MEVAEKELEFADSTAILRKRTQRLSRQFRTVGSADYKPIEVGTYIVKWAKPILQKAVHVYRLKELKSDKYVLRKALFVQIEKTQDGETFIAKIPWLDVYGLGETEEQAVEDFQLSLIEDYELMKEEEYRLSDYLHEHLADLNTVLREI